MKKASEWFDELEPQVASRAKTYLKADKEYKSLKDALMYGFQWSDDNTLEGWVFWKRIADSIGA